MCKGRGAEQHRHLASRGCCSANPTVERTETANCAVPARSHSERLAGTQMNKSRTKLEGFLFWWLVANCLIVLALLLLVAVLPSSIVNVTFYGSTSLVLVVIALLPIISAWAYLTWKMRAPTPRILLFGAILFLLGIVRIEWQGGLWSLNPALAAPMTLIENPSFKVHLDAVAGVISILFFVAWRRRVIAQQSTTAEAANSGVTLG